LTVCALAAMGLMARPCLGVDVVRKGKPVAAIVLPGQPLPVESYAAEELQYHVKAASGAQLQIVSEDTATGAGPRVYLGHCRAAAEAGADPSGLPGNGYVIKTARRNLFEAVTRRAARGSNRADESALLSSHVLGSVCGRAWIDLRPAKMLCLG
jgi:hypothetical protein